jgi:hypothetical protein
MVNWQMDNSGGVKDFRVHFDQSPFDPKFGSGDYCGGAHCPSHPKGTDSLPAHAENNAPDYVRCHQYTLTVVIASGSTVPFDPHIIVGAKGGSQ